MIVSFFSLITIKQNSFFFSITTVNCLCPQIKIFYLFLSTHLLFIVYFYTLFHDINIYM